VAELWHEEQWRKWKQRHWSSKLNRHRLLAIVGPTGMTWHHGGTCWSHVVTWHRGRPSGSPPAGPTVMTWRCGPTDGSHPVDCCLEFSSGFYFIWQKNKLHGSLNPTTYCCKHRWVTTRPLTQLCYSLVCCFICLFIKPNSLFYFPKKLKILHKKVWTYNLFI